MPEIKLSLTVDETNLILEGLGQMPFAKVYALVEKIQSQAGAQLQSAGSPDDNPPPGAAPEREN